MKIKCATKAVFTPVRQGKRYTTDSADTDRAHCTTSDVHLCMAAMCKRRHCLLRADSMLVRSSKLWSVAATPSRLRVSSSTPPASGIANSIPCGSCCCWLPTVLGPVPVVPAAAGASSATTSMPQSLSSCVAPWPSAAAASAAAASAAARPSGDAR